MPVIGSLSIARGGSAPLGNAFRRGLEEMGFVEGRNISIEQQRPESNDGLRDVVADLVRKRVAVIFAADNAAALAAKAGPRRSPSYLWSVSIPLAWAWFRQLIARGVRHWRVVPGERAGAERFELLRVLLPQASVVGVLVNPDNPNAENHAKDLRAAASPSGLRMLVVEARNVADMEKAFAVLAQQQASALLVTADRLFNTERCLLADLAARNTMPTMYPWRDFADAGGLMSYGNSVTDAFRQGGIYSGRILKGDKPGDLPMWQPTRFEFMINLKTAIALGLAVPPTLLATADEVIE